MNLNSISEQFSALGIRHAFPELVAQSIGHRGLIVVDGFERLNQSGLANLAVLLRRARVETDTSIWSFVFTCVVDSWDRAFQALLREYGGGLNVKVKPVAFSFKDHRSLVLKAFPNMARMLQRPNLSSLFGNLKILDLVLSNANEATNTTAWVGESDILDWYWIQHVQSTSDGVARSRFAQKLACLEADQFLTAVPINDFDSDECRLATGLEEDLVIWSRDEQFGFEHDLLGDWARTRYLISRQNEIIETVRDKALNPRWHRAIRLYGLRLLENKLDNNQKWSELIAELSPEGKHNLESDLILESVVFAANPEQLLRHVWTRLVENNGELLTRLLTRFLHVATLPDPQFEGLSYEVAAAALFRVPYWPLWLPMLRILHEHRAEAISLAIDQVTTIADHWLKNSGDTWPLRGETAEILLDATHYVVEEIWQQDWSVDREMCKSVFTRLLTAATMRPDEVAELALSLVERREQSPFATEKEGEPTEVEEKQNHEGSVAHILGFRGPLGAAWPDGPLRRVNHEVHDGFLSKNDPLKFLFAVRPDAATEVLLALLIREPLPATSRAFHSPLDEFLYVDTERDWTPAIFFHGPFLMFLRMNWEKGIAAIVTLINFVTDRWMENRDSAPPSVCTTIDGEGVEYFGASDAYFWYRDSVRSPRAVVPALMALERWLYLCLEHGESIKPAVRQVLRSSRSTALLGVLAAVGRKQPGLFNHELRELFPIWQLQVWEEKYRLEGLDSLLGMTMMQWVRWGEAIFNLVRDWHTLGHRKTTLSDVLCKQFVTDSEFRSLMKIVQAEWSDELATLGDSDDAGFLEHITIRFDEDNWRTRQVENGIVLDFVEPEERTRRLAHVRQDNELHMAVLTFPLTCRRLIDERKVMTNEELEQFWHQLCNIGEDAEDARKRGDTPEHAIMGGIAALTILHQPWLAANPERDTWCSQQFVKVFEAPPPHPEFHVAESVSNYHWNNFAAMLIPRMLVESPAHEAIRSLCAEFALAFNYTVIQDLLSFAFEYRDRLGDDFGRLQHLIIVSSGMRNVKEVVHGGNNVWGCPKVAFDITARFTELIRQFARSETSSEVPRLVDIGGEANNTIVEMVRKQDEMSNEKPTSKDVQESIAHRIRRGRGFEPLHIRSGFSWLEKFEAAKDTAERTNWIDTLENLIRGFLRPLGGIEEALFDDDDDNSFFATPGQWDTWIFDLTASVIPKLEESESAYRLWQPILSFGLDRMHWVDTFISAWFIHGLRVEGCEANFFREWKAMITYAWTRDNWRQTAVRNHHSDDELFRHLMGFSSSGHGYLEDKTYRVLIAAMKPEYDKWTDVFFPHPEATSAFANFLTFPSSVDYLRDGVRRLADASSQFQEWHWRDFYYLDYALLKVLEYDWRENSALISKDAEIRSQFSTILKTMTDRQIPQAMELQDKMIRTN
ncbi:MAG: hypothetical protein SGJ20_06440 [Planctomycetota bacterium]|nr:hypothetical protein [Planctomycetota bacterium]